MCQLGRTNTASMYSNATKRMWSRPTCNLGMYVFFKISSRRFRGVQLKHDTEHTFSVSRVIYGYPTEISRRRRVDNSIPPHTFLAVFTAPGHPYYNLSEYVHNRAFKDHLHSF